MRKVESGLSTTFWHDIWVGNAPMSSRFHRLFTISQRKYGKVSDLGRCERGKVVWDLGWRRYFFIYKEVMVYDFFSDPQSLLIFEGKG